MNDRPSSESDPRPDPTATAGVRVLAVGERRGLSDALRRQGVPFAVWSDPPRRVSRAQFVHGAPLHQSRERARDEARAILERHGPFTHVVAATEAAVLPAAVARRVLGARSAAHTTVLRCRDKLLMKRFLAERGVPMTAFLDAAPRPPPRVVLDELGDEVVVKDRSSSGGRGMVIARSEEELEAALRRGRIAERFVDAPEISVESFVNQREIRFQSVTEYVRKGSVNLVPAGLDEETREAVLALNRKVIESLRISWGVTHVEMYLTEDGPLFGEIALRPPGGYIMELIEAAWGFPVWEAFVAMELDRPAVFPRAPRGTAAVSIFHPGAGTVRAIDGVDALRADPRVARVTLKVGVGDTVPERVGVGVDVGFAMLRGASRDEVLEALHLADRTLAIEVEPESRR